MKRILVALMLLASASAFVQTAIVVHNTTSCTIYYQLLLTSPNGSGCPVSVTSDVFAIPPNSYQDYKGTGVVQPYNVANYDFLGARIYKQNNACSTSYNSIGISCTGFPLNFPMAVYGNTSCSAPVCSNITAVWTPSAGGTSRLSFY